MSDVTFLSHVSRGLGALAQDGSHLLPVSLTLTAQPSGTTHTVNRTIELARPCNVTAIDPGAIFRTDPDHRAEIRDFEPNYLPLVEFAAVDFPWRFSTGPSGAGRNPPWLALIVLATGEYRLRPGGRTADGGSRLASLHIDHPGAVLPPSDQLGAWSHAQAIGDLSTATASDLDTIDRSGTSATRSRLLAARRLKPRTEYLAALVPSTECGRLRGLEPGGEHTHVTGAAWTAATTGPLDLPVYFSWRFATAAAGDVESLARGIGHFAAGPTTGYRDLHIGPQALGVSAIDTPLTQRGALISPDPAPVQGPPQEFTDSLVAALNAPDDLREGAVTDANSASAVAPPLYGDWHADRSRLGDDTTDRPWFDALNRDPEHRAAAGLGAEVVRRHQEDLAAEAWRQVGDLAEARKMIDIARFGMLTADRLHERVLGGVADETVVLLTRLTLPRIRPDGSASLDTGLSATPLNGVADSALARTSFAPRGPLRAAFRRATVAVDTANLVSTLAASTTISPLFAPEISDPLLASAVDPSDQRDPAAVAAPPQAIETSDLAHDIRQNLRPGLTIPGRIDGLIDGLDLATDGSVATPDLPEPQIETPMYAPLRDLAVSHLVPGIGDMVPESAVVLSPNRQFIEAYMAGLNHEFGRELLWRGFPAAGLDVTYFRHFWESAGDHPDIDPMVSWTSALGANGGTGPALVLALRSALVQRYPGLMIYAQRAAFSDGSYQLADTVAEPIFRADLATDILAVGFGIGVEAARGFVPPDGTPIVDHAANVAADPGWFLVLEEQPREARFGLDLPGTGGHGNDWNNVSWSHAAPASARDPGAWHGPIDLAAPTARTLPGDPPWNGSAAEMAEALLQRPFRFGIHAQRLLPDLGEDS